MDQVEKYWEHKSLEYHKTLDMIHMSNDNFNNVCHDNNMKLHDC